MRSYASAVRLVLLAFSLLALPGVAGAQTAQSLYESARGHEGIIRSNLDTLPPGATSNLLAARIRSMVTAYDEIARQFPRSGYSDNALWQAGLLHADAFAHFGDDADRRAALDLLSRVAREYPSSSLLGDLDSLRARLAPMAAQQPRPASPAPPPADMTPPSGPVKLTGIRREVLSGAVRITLVLERETSFRHERLTDPARVFVDLTDTVADGLTARALVFDDDVVRAVRLGTRESTLTRVVLDLEGAAGHSVYALDNPYRVVVDVERKPSATVTVVPRPSPFPVPRETIPDPIAPSPPSLAAAPDVTLLASARPPSTDAPPLAAPPAPSTNIEGDFSLSRQLGLGISRIVIDPGHGGRDPGSVGRGIVESELVLDVALRLEQLLLTHPGIEVVLTRRTNVFIPLEERTAIANGVNADLFLSIHANASLNTGARGVETFFLNFARDPEAESLAARENAGSTQSMRSLPDIVQAIALNDKIDESRDFATMVHNAIHSRLSAVDHRVENRGVKQAPFVVLIGATMPSVLAEISFLTNPQEADLLRTDPYRQHIAEALLEGVKHYQESLRIGVVAAQ